MEYHREHRIIDGSTVEGRRELTNLRQRQAGLVEYDTIDAQLKGLLQLRKPTHHYNEIEMASLIETHLDGGPIEEYGRWIFYPWSNRLVHLLGPEEFAEVRTDRNKLKITKEEQKLLGRKTIGLVGLSVGHAVAMTLALERGFGTLRIADFDTLDLSNLNRIRSATHQIGLAKTIITARGIAELDPYLSVECHHEGLTEANAENFISGLDLLIDECDSLEMKFAMRETAKAHSVPVIMETSDRGMLDVERFDLDASAPIFHGLANGMSSTTISSLTPAERMPLLFSIVSFEDRSDRLKESMGQIGKTISTWPQLGADVTLGGASAAHASRKLLLGEAVPHGRYHLDMSAEFNSTRSHKNPTTS